MNKKYKNFELKRTIALPEIHCDLTEFEHLPTGAQVMHIANDDPENVFCLSFQTTPDSSNGAAHILEHTVLCGSKKFPVKDPFFAMTRRSLNTFMNAFTGADFTCYPAASQVPQDFYNLLEVYLDAVFRPLLNKLSFLQEGCRIEFSKPADPHSPLEYKGIVFNEMKGAMSSPDSRLSEEVDAQLFPDLTYGYNSGGDPKVIPKLTYEELLSFHKKFYHPGRCLFYFYGSIPLEKHLDFIEEHALKGVEKVDPLPLIPLQHKHAKKILTSVEYPYASDEDPSDKCLISFGWLTCHILDQDTLLALTILCTVLLSTDAAPVKKALLKSGLCKQVSAYIVDDYSEIPITITLKGCKEENAEKLEKVIRDALEEVLKKGVPADLIENALHQIEFSRSEITGDSYPYGLALFMRAGLLKQHGGKPEDALLIHSLCGRIRESYKNDPAFFSNLMRVYLLDNPHFVSAIARPAKDLEERENAEERLMLEAIRKKMDAHMQETIIHKAKELAEFQEQQAHADLSILPKVNLAEVPKASTHYPLEVEQIGGLQVFRHSCFTNKIVYADLVFPLPFFEEKELPLLKLATLLFPQMGCGGRSYAQNLEYIQAYTGGVGAAEALNIQVEDFNRFHPYILIHGKALHRNAEKLFNLISEMALSVDFTDQGRLKEVIVKHFTSLQSSLNRNALKYAMNLAASSLTPASRIAYAWNGLEYYHFVKDAVENFEERLPAFIRQLEGIRDRVFCLKDAHLILTCEEEMYQHLKERDFYGLKNMPQKAYSPWENEYGAITAASQGRVIASPVAFTSKIFRSIPYSHPDTTALCAAGQLFDNLVLHPRIREQGGAYGSGAVNNALAGNFCFYAYRDPNILNSLEAFEEAVEKIFKGDFENADIEEAILEIIQGLDTPVSPGSRGITAYTWLREGKTHEVRQAFRDRLLGLNRESIINAIESHILPFHKEACTVVFAGKELLEKENACLISKGKKPLEIKKI